MLEKFLNAQDSGVYEMALKEIQNGKKKTHWMWFIFPQLDGLGFSFMARKYSLKSKEEAKEYIENDTLRERLIEISNAILELNAEDIQKVFYDPDDLKLKSCMTLFKYVSPEISVFQEVLDKYFDGEECEYTRNFFVEKDEKI